MILSRRTLLQAGLGLYALPGLSHLACAGDGPAGDALILVFQRGGCDGLSLLAPSNDPDYLADRVPELRVGDGGPKAGRPVRQTLAPTIDFRLHPDATPLGEIYDSRHLSLLHAVGLANGTRSHFVAQDLMERGVSDAAMLQRVDEGWLTRLLASRSNSVSAITTSPAIPASLGFHGNSLAIPDLRGGLGLPGGPQVRHTLLDLYDNALDPFSLAAASSLREIDRIDRLLPRGADGKVTEYIPDNNSAYEENESGRALRTVARLLKMEIGLSVACVDIGGWDHHDNLAGRFSHLVGQFSRALSAFWNDLSAYHDRVTVVVMTEFGRRLRTNKSNGADHGHGGVMMVLSGHARGGEIYGRWPGLASNQLDNGVDLAVTTDYRAVLAEVIAARLGVGKNLANIFSAFTVPAPLGVVKPS